MCHRAKFRADRSNHCGDMADFKFFKMAAVHHLGISNIKLLPARQIWTPNMRHCAKFHADQSDRCRDMPDFRFFHHF